MANMDSDRFARGARGIVSKEFVRHQTRSGKIIRTGRPLFDDNLTYTGGQTMQQAALRDAATYASFADALNIYLDKAYGTGVTAYYMALTDWYLAPRVLQINVDGWTGRIGETIYIKARDYFQVARVTVTIRDAEGTLLETGEAIPSETEDLWWKYITRSPVSLSPFPIVQATAFDLPGNSDSFTIS